MAHWLVGACASSQLHSGRRRQIRTERTAVASRAYYPPIECANSASPTPIVVVTLTFSS